MHSIGVLLRMPTTHVHTNNKHVMTFISCGAPSFRLEWGQRTLHEDWCVHTIPSRSPLEHNPNNSKKSSTVIELLFTFQLQKCSFYSKRPLAMPCSKFVASVRLLVAKVSVCVLVARREEIKGNPKPVRGFRIARKSGESVSAPRSPRLAARPRCSSLKLVSFEKFDDTTQALAVATATVEGKISKPLKKLLKRLVNPDVQEQLLVTDSTLGKAIKVSNAWINPHAHR